MPSCLSRWSPYWYPTGLPAFTQENLLLSVLPAHISMGMKLAIIERLKEGGDRRYMPDNNFHSLYVKRHQNVRWVCPLGAGATMSRVSWASPLPITRFRPHQHEAGR